MKSTTRVRDRNTWVPSVVNLTSAFGVPALDACPRSRYTVTNEQLPFWQQEGKNWVRQEWKEPVRKAHELCWFYKLWP